MLKKVSTATVVHLPKQIPATKNAEMVSDSLDPLFLLSVMMVTLTTMMVAMATAELRLVSHVLVAQHHNPILAMKFVETEKITNSLNVKIKTLPAVMVAAQPARSK